MEAGGGGRRRTEAGLDGTLSTERLTQQEGPRVEHLDRVDWNAKLVRGESGIGRSAAQGQGE